MDYVRGGGREWEGAGEEGRKRVGRERDRESETEREGGRDLRGRESE
jgi:hypothetical protein